MDYLYIHNFRGFEKTLIPIRDVNFMVGENSTGKTSILALIQLLHNTKFWFTQEFNTDEYTFGHFKDIVTLSPEKKKYFQIGYLSEPHDDDQDEINMFMLSFQEDEGLPIINRYYYVENNREVRGILSNKIVKYKSEIILKKNKDSLRKLFDNWIECQMIDSSGYTKINSKKITRRSDSLMYFPRVAKREYSKKDTLGSYLDIFFHLGNSVGEQVWIAPIRTKPKRTYDGYRVSFTSEGEHTPYLIKRLMDRQQLEDRFTTFIDDFGRESALFESIEINRLGKESTAPFEVRILLGGRSLRMSNVGYGVSQVLPVIVEMFARPKGYSLTIQQPEVHLHPRAQAALGDLIFNLARLDHKKFIIETHSDYLLDRFRLAQGKYQAEDIPLSQVLFFERKEGKNVITSIEIDEKGEYSSDQPSGFRSFFLNEQLNLLGL